MKCPKCGAELSLEAKFCGACGNSLTRMCPVCQKANSIDQVFCIHCGSDIKSSIQGIPLERSLLWKDLFQRLEWSSFTVPGKILAGVVKGEYGSKLLTPVVLELLKQNNGPLNPENENEPWIFISPIVPVNYHVDKLKVFGEEWRRWYAPTIAVIIATRCRFLVSRAIMPALSSSQWNCEAHQWFYRDLVKWNRSGNSFQLSYNKGHGFKGILNIKDIKKPELCKISSVNSVNYNGVEQTIKFEVKTEGPRLLDIAMVASNNTATRLIASSNIGSRSGTKAEFIDVIEEFCRDIGNCIPKR
jgi:hypothetical protein